MRFPGKRSKYGNKKTVVDGITFDSRKEARRYGELRLLEQTGVIVQLQLQPRFDLHTPNGKKVGQYVGDFSYVEVASGQTVIEDSKGFRTQLYRWKKKHVEAEYGFEIREV